MLFFLPPPLSGHPPRKRGGARERIPAGLRSLGITENVGAGQCPAHISILLSAMRFCAQNRREGQCPSPTIVLQNLRIPLSLRGAKRRGALSAKREEVLLGCNLHRLPLRGRMVPTKSENPVVQTTGLEFCSIFPHPGPAGRNNSPPADAVPPGAPAPGNSGPGS